MMSAETSIEFDKAAHRYYVAGVEYPSVTRVLESERLGPNFAFVNGSQLAYARELGDAVHEGAALLDQDDLLDGSLDEESARFVAAWAQFKADHDVDVEKIELRVWHAKYRYAGTLDRLLGFRLRGQRIRALFDLKSGAPHIATGYQTAAYLACLPLAEQHRRRFGLYLQPWRSPPYQLAEYRSPSDLPIFLSALTLFNARKDQRL
jgi:hypothetical protein